MRRVTVREEKIEDYLVRRVEESGGMCEKFTSPGKRGVPDRIVTWPRSGWAQIHFIELKTLGGKLKPWQERDHARRKALGCHVRVLWTRDMVDNYVEEHGARPRPAPVREVIGAYMPGEDRGREY
jgi:hypothetical protein